MFKDLDKPQQSVIVKSGELAEATLGTSAASVLSLGSFPDATRIEIEKIWICNHSNQNRYYSMYFDDNGTTYTTATQMVNQVVVNANNEKWLEKPLVMDDPAGNLAFLSQSTATFTVKIFGKVIRER